VELEMNLVYHSCFCYLASSTGDVYLRLIHVLKMKLPMKRVNELVSWAFRDLWIFIISFAQLHLLIVVLICLFLSRECSLLIYWMQIVFTLCWSHGLVKTWLIIVVICLSLLQMLITDLLDANCWNHGTKLLTWWKQP
jgi:hypothetical protein